MDEMMPGAITVGDRMRKLTKRAAELKREASRKTKMASSGDVRMQSLAQLDVQAHPLAAQGPTACRCAVPYHTCDLRSVSLARPLACTHVRTNAHTHARTHTGPRPDGADSTAGPPSTHDQLGHRGHVCSSDSTPYTCLHKHAYTHVYTCPCTCMCSSRLPTPPHDTRTGEWQLTLAAYRCTQAHTCLCNAHVHTAHAYRAHFHV